MDAIRYLVKEGIQWRAMPADLPHWRTVYDVADGWHNSGATGKMHDELRRQCRIAAGRTPEPTAAVIGSQSVKAAETVGKGSRGFDAGKKTSDAVVVSSGQAGAGLLGGGEGRVLVKVRALGQAVVKAADHAVEQVALSGCVPVPGFAPPVVVSPRSG